MQFLASPRLAAQILMARPSKSANAARSAGVKSRPFLLQRLNVGANLRVTGSGLIRHVKCVCTAGPPDPAGMPHSPWPPTGREFRRPWDGSGRKTPPHLWGKGPAPGAPPDSSAHGTESASDSVAPGFSPGAGRLGYGALNLVAVQPFFRHARSSIPGYSMLHNSTGDEKCKSPCNCG